MYSAMTQILAFVVGIVGEQMVIKWIGQLRYWWENYVAEELKAKCDDAYNKAYPASKDLGNVGPDNQN